MDEGKDVPRAYASFVAYLDNIFSFFEEDLLSSTEFIANVVRRWDASCQENQALKALAASYQKDLTLMRQYSRDVNEKLAKSRSQVISLVSTKKTLLAEKQSLEKQLNSVRSLLADPSSLSEESRKRLEFLTSNSSSLSSAEPASELSLADVDFDNTDDSLLEQPQTAPKEGEPREVSRKRSNSSGSRGPTVTEDGYNDEVSSKLYKIDSSVKPKTDNIENMRTGPALSIISGSLVSSLDRRLSEFGLRARTSIVNNPLTPFISGDGQISYHSFSLKTVFFGETCEVCSRKIGFGKVMLRCLDCGVKMHQQCGENAFQTCVPRMANLKCRRGLKDYVPLSKPFIPKVVIDLVNEIEQRGLDYAGLYRIPGPDLKVKNLLYKLLDDRPHPNLVCLGCTVDGLACMSISTQRSISDVAVLTGCLKKFFQQLVEPLIPYTSRAEFMNIAVADIGLHAQMKRIHKEIMELPLPNLHTLAFLLVHLQKVSECSEMNKMPITNLARVFGPTVVGTFSKAKVSLSDMLDEAAKQEKVLTLLLSLPRPYWTQHINNGSASCFAADTFGLPGTSREYSPWRRQIYSPLSKMSGAMITKTPKYFGERKDQVQ